MRIKNIQQFVGEKIISGSTNKKILLENLIDEYLYGVIPVLLSDEELLPIFGNIVSVQEKLTNLKVSL